MQTKGYHRYQGRTGKGQTVITVVLVLVIVAALAYLVLDNYLVYDDAGRLHFQFRDPYQDDREGNPIDPEEVEIVYNDPGENGAGEDVPPAISTTLPELRAAQLPADALRKQGLMSTLLQEESDEAIIIEVKHRQGALAYNTAVSVPDSVPVYREGTLERMQEILDTGRYTVARISALWDGYYVRDHRDSALLRQNADGPGLWYDLDNSNRTWLNPADERVITYLSDLARECAELGFDEILLDDFHYPTSRSADKIINISGDRAGNLSALAGAIRSAVPKGVLVSVVVREEAVNARGGLTAKMMANTFDRLYLPPDATADTLLSALPESFDQASRLIPMVYTKPDTGSYALVTG